ncbi:hypothetical protein PENSPDRAFT_100275 [Peniophora sp. CONT]|nr:hypothetical protein PENSPDRAFT_100275 [Peniophora sp. CONT]
MRTPRVLDSLLRFHAFEACRACSIRPRLDIKSLVQKPAHTECDTVVYGGSRIHRVLICELRPVKALDSAAFLKAFLDIILCHFILWTRHDVYHRVVSLDILKYETVNGKIAGLLTDIDLAACPDDRSGTLQYMAQELLDARPGHKLAHHYRYDLESFYWILIWICNCVEHGKDVKPLPKPFRCWKSADYDTVFEKRFPYEHHAWKYWSTLPLSRLALSEIAMRWLTDFVCRVRPRVTFSKDGLSYGSDPYDCFGSFCDMLSSDDMQEELQYNGEEGEALLECIRDFLGVAQGYRRQIQAT